MVAMRPSRDDGQTIADAERPVQGNAAPLSREDGEAFVDQGGRVHASLYLAVGFVPFEHSLLALRFDCLVAPAHVVRLNGAHFRMTLEPPLELPKSGDAAADRLTLMTTVNAIVERWVREHPEQWLWLHRRWPD